MSAAKSLAKEFHYIFFKHQQSKPLTVSAVGNNVGHCGGVAMVQTDGSTRDWHVRNEDISRRIHWHVLAVVYVFV